MFEKLCKIKKLLRRSMAYGGKITDMIRRATAVFWPCATADVTDNNTVKPRSIVILGRHRKRFTHVGLHCTPHHALYLLERSYFRGTFLFVF